jgi:DNA repair exonuclease SbcCD ATPase subunit
MSKHTPEPWSFDKYDNIIAGSDRLLLGGIATPMTAGHRMDEGKDNARRIVACVNACRGLPTDELEQKGVVAAVGAELLKLDGQLAELRQERQREHDLRVSLAGELEVAKQQIDELLEEMQVISKINWRSELAGLDRPADFAERQAALSAFGNAQSIAKKSIAKAKGGAA